MEWTLIYSFCCSLLLSGYSLESCFSSYKPYPQIELENASNFSKDCPRIKVESEETCLKELCAIVHSKNSCHGNGVQLKSDGRGSFICYILELHNCELGTATCKFDKNPMSKIILADRSNSQEDYNYICPTHLCDDGECIEKLDSKCDGIVDCQDSSDEIECCDPPSFYECKSDGKCINATVKCDGYSDCKDGSDEMGCHEYVSRRNASRTLMITAISVGVILSLLLIVLMFACGQKLYMNHADQRQRLRNLRLGSSGADYVVRLLPGEAPFQDTLPPSYNDAVLNTPEDEPPGYEPESLLNIAERSGYTSPEAPKETQGTVSSNITESDSAGPSVEGMKLESDQMNYDLESESDLE